MYRALSMTFNTNITIAHNGVKNAVTVTMTWS